MKQYNRVLDYIIDQSDKYDIKNLQGEEDIVFALSKKKSSLDISVMSMIKLDINTPLQVNVFMKSIINIFNRYYNGVALILDKGIQDYYDRGYGQMEDLIQLGGEVSNRLSEPIKEMRYGHYDENTIEFIRKHAMELAKGYSDNKISQIRATISNLMLQNKTNKATVRKEVQKILDINKSKAEEIARTELNRAYNYGVLDKLYEYSEQHPDENVRKYWHGFAYSQETCEYCRSRIGNIYDIDDDSETLPAHVRCRCVWLPVLGGWDKPVSKQLISRANMLNAAYSDEYIYDRINTRLGISYADKMGAEAASDYIAGDRSEKVMNAIRRARESAISDIKSSINISSDTDGGLMSSKFNTQMNFWKDIISTAIVDNDNDTLNKSYEAIKAVMLLPWNAAQLSKWNDLLRYIKHE